MLGSEVLTSGGLRLAKTAPRIRVSGAGGYLSKAVGCVL